jgi:hypothetical protein
MRAFLGLLIVAVVVATTSWSCLVESGCISNDDCDSPELCSSYGVCRLECDEAAGRFCTTDRPICMMPEHRCVSCIETSDCSGAGHECINHQCVPGMAPDFTLVDQNPDSATFGESYALADLNGQVVMLFFAGLG